MCSFGCFVFLVGIRVCLLSHDDDSNGFMTFYELHVFQSVTSTNSLYSSIHLQSLGGGSLWLLRPFTQPIIVSASFVTTHLGSSYLFPA